MERRRERASSGSRTPTLEAVSGIALSALDVVLGVLKTDLLSYIGGQRLLESFAHVTQIVRIVPGQSTSIPKADDHRRVCEEVAALP